MKPLQANFVYDYEEHKGQMRPIVTVAIVPIEKDDGSISFGIGTAYCFHLDNPKKSEGRNRAYARAVGAAQGNTVIYSKAYKGNKDYQRRLGQELKLNEVSKAMHLFDISQSAQAKIVNCVKFLAKRYSKTTK